jgi:hypothetical protein
LQDVDATVLPRQESSTPGPDEDAQVSTAEVDPKDVDSQPEPGPTGREAATDGGPMAPPEPQSVPVPDEYGGGGDDVDQEASDDVGTLPDRYVPVDEYLETCRDELTDDQVDQLAEMLEPFDVVDVEATTRTNVAAHRREDLEI